jgi:hypothetical protein
MGHVRIGQRVGHFPPAPMRDDHAGPAEHAQMLGDQRLRCSDGVDKFVNAAVAAVQLHDDRDPQR